MDKPGRNKDWIGAYGELAATSFLRKRGCKILRRNWRPTRGGELDIVCRDGDTLVFVEVKTRTNEGFGGGRRAVNARKRELIREGASSWRRMLPEDVPHRYDIIEVLYTPGVPPQITHLIHAFRDKE